MGINSTDIDFKKVPGSHGCARHGWMGSWESRVHRVVLQYMVIIEILILRIKKNKKIIINKRIIFETLFAEII